MAEKTRIIDIYGKEDTFSYVLRKVSGKKQDYDFSDMSLLRKLLSNEKARLLNVVKIKKPTSIYGLAKLLDRDFKSVRDDVLLLKKFGFLDLIPEKTLKNNRPRLRPILTTNTINIVIRI